VSEPEPTGLGHGWISGVLSIVLGILGLGGVFCLLYPERLTTPTLRELYPVPLMRALIHFILVASFAAGSISIVLRRRKTMGIAGVGLATLAVLLGGWDIPIEGDFRQRGYLGLDWFLLNLLALALVFVPMERLFARLREQGIFRAGWRTDAVHFFVSHLLVQVSVFLTLLPSKVFFAWAVSERLHRAVASQPYLLQFVEIILVADLAEYWVHRAFHRVPWLWRFHAVHHSCERMDWLASARLHLVDIAATRALTFLPLYLLGFASGPIFAYLVFVSFHAIFIHANVNFDFGRLERWVATPRFHHWHHGAEPRAVDKNFAIHLPWLDRLFGTYLLPGKEWPAVYGIAGNPVPENYLAHLVYPFRPDPGGAHAR
jgi:sterol desaturase/sphingolipid hydroxylase (fatty acid hydroxylase superfamily)